MKNSTQINCLVLSVLIVFFNKMFNHKNVTTILNLITNIDIKTFYLFTVKDLLLPACSAFTGHQGATLWNHGFSILNVFPSVDEESLEISFRKPQSVFEIIITIVIVCKRLLCDLNIMEAQ